MGFQSLKKNHQFRQVYSKGKSCANRQLILYILENGGDTRIGISVSKKIGGAVVRNRQKRLIKQAYRALASQVLTGYDLVFIVRAGMVGMSFNEVAGSIRHLLKKHEIYRGRP